jgi:hypothetical protein
VGDCTVKLPEAFVTVSQRMGELEAGLSSVTFFYGWTVAVSRPIQCLKSVDSLLMKPGCYMDPDRGLLFLSTKCYELQDVLSLHHNRLTVSFQLCETPTPMSIVYIYVDWISIWTHVCKTQVTLPVAYRCVVYNPEKGTFTSHSHNPLP